MNKRKIPEGRAARWDWRELLATTGQENFLFFLVLDRNSTCDT